MKRIYVFLIGLLSVVGLVCTSCDAQLDQVNPNKETEDTFWQDEADFELALTSIYTPLKIGLGGGYYGTRSVMMRIARADEVEFRNDIGEVFQACYFTNTNGNSLSQGMFYQFYNGMYRVNTILQKIEEKEDSFSEDFINKIKGECLFMRGFYLFQLGKEFNNAPIRLTASQSSETFPLEKSGQAEVWAQAERDLIAAVALLPVDKEIASAPTKGAAFAVLGKMYVYLKEFDKAIEVLEPLTQSPYSYELVKDFAWNFDNVHEFNSESIFEIPFDPVGGADVWGDENINASHTTTRAKEYAAAEVGGWYEANPTQQIMDMFEAEKDKDGNFDYRARVSVAWDYPGSTYYMKDFRTIFSEEKWNSYWILKYQNWNTAESEGDPPASAINDRAVRYADVLLLLAESYLRGPQDLPKAIAYLNRIRERANLNPYSGAQTYQAVFDDLEHQRALEFFVEGERFYDLRRWGLLEKRMETCNPTRYKQLKTGKVGDTNRYYYYPIPSKELETNPLCTPNEGW